MMPPFGSDIATPLKSSTRDPLRDGRLWGDYRVAALVYAQTRVSCTMTLTHYRILRSRHLQNFDVSCFNCFTRDAGLRRT